MVYMIRFRIISFIVALLCAMSLQAQKCEHIVQRGENFSSIAQKYGITVEELKASNPASSSCYVGRKLLIPNPGQVIERKPAKVEPYDYGLTSSLDDSVLTKSSTTTYQVGEALWKNNKYSEAIVYLNSAAEKGDVRAYYPLGDCYSQSSLDFHNDGTAAVMYLKAIKEMRPKNDVGYIMPCLRVSKYYLTGTGLKKDVKQARYYYNEYKKYAGQPICTEAKLLQKDLVAEEAAIAKAENEKRLAVAKAERAKREAEQQRRRQQATTAKNAKNDHITNSQNAANSESGNKPPTSGVYYYLRTSDNTTASIEFQIDDGDICVSVLSNGSIFNGLIYVYKGIVNGKYKFVSYMKMPETKPMVIGMSGIPMPVMTGKFYKSLNNMECFFLPKDLRQLEVISGTLNKRITKEQFQKSFEDSNDSYTPSTSGGSVNMPRAPKIEYQKADRRLYVPCRSCGGTGRCRTCNGTGDRGDTKNRDETTMYWKCTSCRGSGRCDICRGIGKIYR